MNRELTKTRSEQRIEQLVNCGRPLTEEESDELFRALHADYMRKWRIEKRRRDADKKRREELEMPKVQKERLLKRLHRELAPTPGKVRFAPLAETPEVGVIIPLKGKPSPAYFLTPHEAKSLAQRKAARG